MIPGSFEYHRPDTVEAAIALIDSHGDEARVIAGGHSLVPLMKMRMTALEHLVDLQSLDELKGIDVSGTRVTIGAMVTQHELITSSALAEVVPIIAEAALQIGDPQVRYMGTIGGNVANGDPGNDMPGLMQCLNAQYSLQGPNGTREVAARDFYESIYFTARKDNEILTSISFDVMPGGYAYLKQKRKIGDYATAATAVLLQKEGDTCSYASVAMTNLAETPIYCEAASEALAGSTLDSSAIDKAVAAMLGAINPAADSRGPIEFKKHIAGVILRRAIDSAIARA